jgi:Flp pilus assembly protein protease CpaA
MVDVEMTFPWVVATAATLAAIVTDVRHFRIPNLLTGPLLVAGLVYAWSLDGLSGLLFSSAGVLAGFLFLLPLYLVGGMGAGDVKLMGALGAWLKTASILDVLVVSCLLTAAISFVMLWRRKRRMQVGQPSRLSEQTSQRPAENPEPAVRERGVGQPSRLSEQAFQRPAENPEPAESEPVRERVEDIVTREDRRERLIPFSVMILAGLVVAWLRT